MLLKLFKILNIKLMYKGIETYPQALNGLIPGTKGPLPCFKSLYNKLIVYVTEIIENSEHILM